MSLVGQVFSNRYRIEREIAHGGMAEVYLARDESLDRLVALKALFPEYAREPSFVERFRREAQAAANLNHPNIVAIYDWGQESGTYFIVMEYVEGRSLRDLIRSEGRLDAGQAADITAEIASALAFAHRSGVVHRDVKPGNVLLTRSGTVKVTDFGIARAGTSDALTQTGSVMGTATYFSPEQAQGLAVDGRSDVYSVGVVLYELVCGVAPFVAESPVSVAYKHVREEPVPPRQRNPEVPAALEQIIMSALAKDPEHRYQSADDLRADLLRFRRGRPLMAAPVTAMIAEVPTGAVPAAYAASATVASPRVPVVEAQPKEPRRRRHPALFTILTLIALVAVVGGILFASMKLGGNQVSVTVPKVVGKTQQQATELLAEQHLFGVPKQVASAKPVGLVVAQDPKADESVKKNSKVTLSISGGVGTTTVHDVTGMTVAQARAELTSQHLEVAVDGAQSSKTIDPGSVISTIPAADAEATIGSTVHIIPSSGVSIPNVLNFQQANAAVVLTNAGLTPQAVPTESSTVPTGNVIRTDPAAGTNNIAAGSIIRVYISTGAPQVTVPTVIGKAVDKAQQELNDAKLQSSVVFQTTTSKGNDGKVLDQNPGGGILVDPQTTVVLTVGQFSAPVTSTPTTAGGGPTTTTLP